MIDTNPESRFGESAKAIFPRDARLRRIIKFGFFSLRNGSMQETGNDLKPILDYLMEKRGFDFSGYNSAMLARRIGQRLTAAACKDFGEYLSCLQRHAAELDNLIDAVTINVSRFYRDTLTFELIADRILPALVREKTQARDHSLRVWSAGCARGEEPYSLAILIHELLRKEEVAMNLHLFATDIDCGALADARKALYPPSSLENVKHRLLTKFFTPEGRSFRLIPEIKEMVAFSSYDMLDKKRGVPPESVFGAFDLVLCRNLLIYFNTGYREKIFERLYHSLANHGYLVLGEAEAPTMAHRHHFSRAFEFSPIYRKR
jgi:chemotaxis protein methyltransferase CheR